MEKDFNPQEKAPPLEVPIQALSPEILRALIESFILREGTDYGRNEVEFETKVEQIEKQLKKGQVRIIFDPITESVTLMTDRDWKKSRPL
jgi:uncharacterized protein YheU (UPF0270 family)